MIYDIYCDESRQDLLINKEAITPNNKYACIGGLMLPRSKRKNLKKQIAELRIKHGVFGELKWGTVSNNKIDFYKELIDLFFSFGDDLLFRNVVINTVNIDNDKFNESDPELGYYKFYYQLIYHWISITYKYGSRYYIYTDYKTNKINNRQEVLKAVLNRSWPNTVKLIQSIDSKESDILQLQNVLMGAVGYKYNWKDCGHSQAKIQLVKYIEKKLGHSICATSKNEKKFNVFNIILKNPKGAI